MHILGLLDEIRAIALTGLHYEQGEYNRLRYERLLELAAAEYAALTGEDAAVVAENLRREPHYITPKTGTNGAIFDDEGRVLLVKRSDNGRWCLPGGYAEVNQTPEQNARREVWEETGLEVEVGPLIKVFCVLPGEYGQTTTNYIMVYYCTVTGGTLTPSHETPELGFYDPADITDWHSSHQQRVVTAQAFWRNLQGR